MKVHFEKLASNESGFRCFERADSEFPFYWHYHPEYELTLIVDSCGQRLVGDSIADYQRGDLVLLGPNLPHSWRSGPIKSRPEEIHRAIVIQFREDFLGEQFFQLKEMEQVARLLKHSASGLAFGHTKTGEQVALELAKLPRLPSARRLLTLLSALIDLEAESNAQVLSTNRVQPACRVVDQQRIDTICQYLNSHFEDEIEFSKLASRLYMSQASLCRFFKRATGRTMTQYVNEIRVGAAAQLLTGTDQSILEIGFNVGFGNYSNFNRQFKRIKGYGPRKLRDQFLSSSAIPQRSSSAAVSGALSSRPAQGCAPSKSNT